MKWLLCLFFPFFAFAEEKYPKHLLTEMEIISCRGGSNERQDVTARVVREREVFLYKLQQPRVWVTKPLTEPKSYVILNSLNKSCDELVNKKLNVFERAQKSDECKKKPSSHWWCRHEVFNLLTYPSWLNDYK
jgi:hypothetical protein